MSAYGPLAQWYDDLTADVPYSDFADWYEAAFARRGRPVYTVLDLACGTGTLTLLLAERGYEMIGVDASSEMLSVLREKAEGAAGEPPLLLCQDLTELDLYGTVDAAVCSLDAMNYLPPEDLPELLRRLHLFLEPDGLFLFDIQAPERLRARDGQVFVDETEDVFCLWRGEYDAEVGSLFYGMDLFIREGALWRREAEEHVEYAHTPENLRALLKQAGFVNIEVDTRGPQSGEGRIFLIAENTPHPMGPEDR